MNSTDQSAWRKSSRCGNSTCVEIATVDGGYLIRDSKNPDQAPLQFTEEELAVFAASFTAGEFRQQ
jgi:hypothetical protein